MWIISPNSEVIPTISIVYFFSVTISLIVAKSVPQLDRFFRHGKLNLHSQNKPVPQILHQLANITVPKRWFAYFYQLFFVLMLALSYLNWLNEYTDYSRLIWVLLLIQGARRTYECKFVSKWGAQSRMHISHFLVGIVFYVLVSFIAFTGCVGTETLETLEKRTKSLEEISKRTPLSKADVRFSLLPSDYLLAIVFLAYSFDQYRNHVHLSKLIKYTAPSIGMFNLVSCAHYFDEIMLYGIVMAISIKLGRWSLQSLAFLAAWTFVVVNLSISAKDTQAFYSNKFRDYSVKHSIIPFLY